MSAVIGLDQIRKSYFMGKQELQVLKGISCRSSGMNM